MTVVETAVDETTFSLKWSLSFPTNTQQLLESKAAPFIGLGAVSKCSERVRSIFSWCAEEVRIFCFSVNY